MTTINVGVEASEVGMSQSRLDRLDRHFRGYVDDGRLTGWLLAVARQGQVAHLSSYGMRDREAAAPVETDTVWRLASMSKPVTSVAAMMLYEEGAFELKDPISRWIPGFDDMQVFRSGSSIRPELGPATEPIRVWHLLTHTSGLTYGFQYAHPVDAMYRAAGFEWGNPAGVDLAGCCELWAAQPLLFEPGTEWNYGVSTDVLGRLIEVVSGQSLDSFLRERIFEPLGMVDTGFDTADAVERLAAPYVVNPAGADSPPVRLPGDPLVSPPEMLSGGGGLVGTAADYLRLSEMLRRGGELDGTRLLSSRTVSYMTTNHLPGGVDLEEFGRPLFAETTFDGVGFGLGVSVVTDPQAGKVLTSVGEYGWGGAFSTSWWVAPGEDLSVLFFTQLLPSNALPIRSQLKQLVYQALI
ncbi:MAG: serine hydrolase domain-containing protein [Acidimicrobiales bacterium]